MLVAESSDHRGIIDQRIESTTQSQDVDRICILGGVLPGRSAKEIIEVFSFPKAPVYFWMKIMIMFAIQVGSATLLKYLLTWFYIKFSQVGKTWPTVDLGISERISSSWSFLSWQSF